MDRFERRPMRCGTVQIQEVQAFRYPKASNTKQTSVPKKKID